MEDKGFYEKAEMLYESIIKNKIFRVLFAISVPAVCIAGLLYLYFYGNPFFCVTYELTGLYCPGCGAGRALRSILNLKIIDAIGYNVFFVFAFPIVAYYSLVYYTKIVFGRDVLPYVKTGSKTALFLLIIIVVYTILRNIPFEPFSILAP